MTGDRLSQYAEYWDRLAEISLTHDTEYPVTYMYKTADPMVNSGYSSSDEDDSALRSHNGQ